MTRRELWEMIGRWELRRGGGEGRCKKDIKHMFFDLLYLLWGFFFTEKIIFKKKRMVKYWTSLTWDCHWKFLEAPFIKSRQIYIYIYNLHGLSCQEKVSSFSMLPIPCNRTSLAVSQWKLRMVLMVGHQSSRLNQNKPFSRPVSTLLSSSAEFYSFSLSRPTLGP